jgi:L-threonine-O-3-phosphate decarboxylase
LKHDRVLSARPETTAISPVYHGALDYAELERLGLDPEGVLDFSVNSNPYGPSPAVREAVARVPLDRYPDRESRALRRALAERLDVAPARIMVGNGTAELIWLVAFAFLQPRDRVLVVGPTFGEYRRTAALMGAQVQMWIARPEQEFVADPEKVEQCLWETKPRMVFVCNPNNPTGTIMPPEVMAAWAYAHPGTLFVIDEAYLAFAPGLQSVLNAGADNILVLRSMTKDYALAGLRLGYAMSHVPIIAALSRVRPAWNVNALAQAAGLAALGDEAYRQHSLQALAQSKEKLVAGLAELGLPPLPSATHFFLVHVGDGETFRQALLRQGILVRDCASFGLPAYVRIATRRPEENARLLEAIRAILSGDR